MTTLQSLSRCPPRKVRKFLLRCIYAGLVANIIGSPAIGKSSIVRSVADELQLGMIDHRLSTSAPEDLSGLPHFDKNGHACFAPFADLFPLEGAPLPEGKQGWLLFLDEFTSAHKDVQAAAYKLILDRMVGQHKLHERVVIVCAGNLMTDRAIVNKLGTAMQSRLVTIEMEVDFKEWLEDVAFKHNYDPRIIAYLSQYPSKLFDFRPDHTDHTFCAPRTWGFMNALIKDEQVLPEDTPLYAGTITSGIAVEFVTFCGLLGGMVTVEDILKDPEKCRLPESATLKWATITHIMEKITPANFTDLTTYVNRLDSTFVVLFFRSVMVRQPSLRNHPAFISAMVKLSRYLN